MDRSRASSGQSVHEHSHTHHLSRSLSTPIGGGGQDDDDNSSCYSGEEAVGIGNNVSVLPPPPPPSILNRQLSLPNTYKGGGTLTRDRMSVPPSTRDEPVLTVLGEKNNIKNGVKLKIILLDDSFVWMKVQPKTLASSIYKTLVDHLNLLEYDYFGLEYKDSGSNNFYWLDNNKKLKHQVGLSLNPGGNPTELFFIIKFYTPDPILLEEEYTRYLYTLQIKRDLYSGSLICNNLNTVAMVASYLIQAECGDYNSSDYSNTNYLNGYKFIQDQDQELEDKICENHKKHLGLNPEQADLYLLEIIRRIEFYGIKLFNVKDSETSPNQNLQLAVTHSGINIYQNLIKITTLSWSKIRKISFKRKKFILKLHNTQSPCSQLNSSGQDTIEFIFSDRNVCKSFWKRCVETHSFFRAGDKSLDSGGSDNSAVGKRALNDAVLSRGSSFRYSGRTQTQMISFVRSNFIQRNSCNFGKRPNSVDPRSSREGTIVGDDLSPPTRRSTTPNTTVSEDYLMGRRAIQPKSPAISAKSDQRSLATPTLSTSSKQQTHDRFVTDYEDGESQESSSQISPTHTPGSSSRLNQPQQLMYSHPGDPYNHGGGEPNHHPSPHPQQGKGYSKVHESSSSSQHLGRILNEFPVTKIKGSSPTASTGSSIGQGKGMSGEASLGSSGNKRKVKPRSKSCNEGKSRTKARKVLTESGSKLGYSNTLPRKRAQGHASKQASTSTLESHHGSYATLETYEKIPYLLHRNIDLDMEFGDDKLALGKSKSFNGYTSVRKSSKLSLPTCRSSYVYVNKLPKKANFSFVDDSLDIDPGFSTDGFDLVRLAVENNGSRYRGGSPVRRKGDKTSPTLKSIETETEYRDTFHKLSSSKNSGSKPLTTGANANWCKESDSDLADHSVTDSTRPIETSRPVGGDIRNNRKGHAFMVVQAEVLCQGQEDQDQEQGMMGQGELEDSSRTDDGTEIQSDSGEDVGVGGGPYVFRPCTSSDEPNFPLFDMEALQMTVPRSSYIEEIHEVVEDEEEGCSPPPPEPVVTQPPPELPSNISVSSDETPVLDETLNLEEVVGTLRDSTIYFGDVPKVKDPELVKEVVSEGKEIIPKQVSKVLEDDNPPSEGTPIDLPPPDICPKKTKLVKPPVPPKTKAQSRATFARLINTHVKAEQLKEKELLKEAEGTAAKEFQPGPSVTSDPVEPPERESSSFYLPPQPSHELKVRFVSRVNLELDGSGRIISNVKVGNGDNEEMILGRIGQEEETLDESFDPEQQHGIELETPALSIQSSYIPVPKDEKTILNSWAAIRAVQPRKSSTPWLDNLPLPPWPESVEETIGPEESPSPKVLPLPPPMFFENVVAMAHTRRQNSLQRSFSVSIDEESGGSSPLPVNSPRLGLGAHLPPPPPTIQETSADLEKDNPIYDSICATNSENLSTTETSQSQDTNTTENSNSNSNQQNLFRFPILNALSCISERSTQSEEEDPDASDDEDTKEFLKQIELNLSKNRGGSKEGSSGQCPAPIHHSIPHPPPPDKYIDDSNNTLVSCSSLSKGSCGGGGQGQGGCGELTGTTTTTTSNSSRRNGGDAQVTPTPGHHHHHHQKKVSGSGAGAPPNSKLAPLVTLTSELCDSSATLNDLIDDLVEDEVGQSTEDSTLECVTEVNVTKVVSEMKLSVVDGMVVI